MLAVERGPDYGVAVNCSGTAESWIGSATLRKVYPAFDSGPPGRVQFLWAWHGDLGSGRS